MKFVSDTERSVYERISKELPGIIKKKCNGYDELYGYKLVPCEPGKEFYKEEIATSLIYKLCKAYQFQYEAIETHLVNVLNWRREFNPLSAAFLEVHDKELVEVGLLTQYPNSEANKKVITWNLYGKLTKKKHLFKDSDKFLRYRVGLMEQGLKLLNFDDESNSYMTQVHDYKGVSLWKYDSDLRVCVKNIINVFQSYYPELLYAKYFVNVPSIFSWVYDAIMAFVDERTKKKFVVLRQGKKLGNYIKDVPHQDYGGKDVKTLEEQNMNNVRPTEYAQFLLEGQANQEID